MINWIKGLFKPYKRYYFVSYVCDNKVFGNCAISVKGKATTSEIEKRIQQKSQYFDDVTILNYFEITEQEAKNNE